MELDVLKKMKMKLNIEYAHCIIVVQEVDIFMVLRDCPMFKNVPVIIITDGGIPEFTTRFFLHRLSTEFPQIPMFGLVDWSPAGLEVLCAYKYGKSGLGFERNKLACSNMEWLGVTYNDISELEGPLENCPKRVKRQQRAVLLLEPLMPEDEEIVGRLKSWKELDDDYKNELDNMAEMKRKSCTRAVEACYSIRGGSLSAYVLSKVYTDSRNIRWFSKMMNNNTSLQA